MNDIRFLGEFNISSVRGIGIRVVETVMVGLCRGEGDKERVGEEEGR